MKGLCFLFKDSNYKIVSNEIYKTGTKDVRERMNQKKKPSFMVLGKRISKLITFTYQVFRKYVMCTLGYLTIMYCMRIEYTFVSMVP